MDEDISIFFCGHPSALNLYQIIADRILEEIDNVKIKVSKTQISFSNKRNFAFVSFLPVKTAKERGKDYITVSFGHFKKCESPRIDAVAEAYPGRWTHHICIKQPEEIDEELLNWIKEAAALSASKR